VSRLIRRDAFNGILLSGPPPHTVIGPLLIANDPFFKGEAGL